MEMLIIIHCNSTLLSDLPNKGSSRNINSVEFEIYINKSRARLIVTARDSVRTLVEMMQINNPESRELQTLRRHDGTDL